MLSPGQIDPREDQREAAEVLLSRGGTSLLKKLHLDSPLLNDPNPKRRPACVGKTALECLVGEKPKPGAVAEASRVAHQFCLGCPVRAACSAVGDSGREEGVWGGVYRVRGKTARSYTRIDLLDPDLLEPAA